jgi:ParB family transcriptional regulator, chromosome partitioning protein
LELGKSENQEGSRMNIFINRLQKTSAALDDIPLDSIDDNPFNSRQVYDDQEIRRLADSVVRVGLLSPIQVRRFGDRYQLVYGHRRVRASRLLDHQVISAQIVPLSDKEMLEATIVENFAREELCDYELALSFQRLNKEFGATHEEIGKMVGLSRSHVANFLRMLQLFDKEELTEDHHLRKAIYSISEHHARVLLRIKNDHARAQAAKMIIEERLSVRDLERLISGLRSWFETGQLYNTEKESQSTQKDLRTRDLLEVQKAVVDIFHLPFTNDFKAFEDLHHFEGGFSSWSAFPPFERLDGPQCLNKDKNWFYSVAPRLSAKIRDLKIEFYGDAALATFYVNFKGQHIDSDSGFDVRGTVLFARKSNTWKIVHEHWSRSMN